MSFFPFTTFGLYDVAAPPRPRPGWALFLDFDGTLVDIAQQPEAIWVPPDLPDLLMRTSAALGGALAIVSGRPLSDIDRRLSPFKGPAAGEHGCGIRRSDGSKTETREGVPPDVYAALSALTKTHPGTHVEAKPHSVAMHFRQAPEAARALEAAMIALETKSAGTLELIQGSMVLELRPRGHSKARAVMDLMCHAPFAGRRPIFVGDDIADEEGIAACERMGGAGYNVHRSFAGRTAEVRLWLEAIASDAGPALAASTRAIR
jgi:trehalose 6-phosphate phosphatase